MGSLKEKVREIERDEILRALQECEWVMARASRRLGITERMIAYKIQKYGIRREVQAEGSTRFGGGSNL